MSTSTEPSRKTHLYYLNHALSLARLSPPKPTNFRVGCVIVSFPPTKDSAQEGSKGEDGSTGNVEGKILATGYTLELEGNTHAEQNALAKLAQQAAATGDSRDSSSPSSVNALLTPRTNAYLYTTLEPCGLRLSGADPCVSRILSTRHDNAQGGIRKVIFGAREPGTFVQDSKSLRMLDEGGVPWEFVRDGELEREILNVSKAGHVTEEKEEEEGGVRRGTNLDDIPPEERRRQEVQPRNPKKRMMEVDLSRSHSQAHSIEESLRRQDRGFISGNCCRGVCLAFGYHDLRVERALIIRHFEATSADPSYAGRPPLNEPITKIETISGAGNFLVEASMWSCRWAAFETKKEDEPIGTIST